MLQGPVIVTGAAGAVGEAIARHYVNAGSHVICTDIDFDALARVVDDLNTLPGNATARRLDVSDPDDVEQFASEVLSESGPPQSIFSNAGVMGRFGELWSQAPADIDWVYRVNVTGTLNLIRSFVPAMTAAGRESRFIVTGSDACFTPMPFVSLYHLSKHALAAVTEGLQLELELIGSPVSVHLVCPLGVDAPRLTSADRFRLRPAALTGSAEETSAGKKVGEFYRGAHGKQSATDVAREIVAGVERGDFYIYPDPRLIERLHEVFAQVTSNGRPNIPPYFAAAAAAATS